MTIEQILQYTGDLVPNTISNEIKLFWISELEGKLTNEPATFSYENNTGMGAELSISHPYDGIYISYLCAMISLALGDAAQYNSYIMKYNDDYEEYQKVCGKTAHNTVKMYYGR